MEKKYKVDCGEINYGFTCKPSELKRKVKEVFKIQQPFQLQIFDDGFEEWLGVADIEQIPTLSKLKVQITANPQANQPTPSGGGGSQNFGPNVKSTGVIAHTITGGQVGGENSQYGGTRNIDDHSVRTTLGDGAILAERDAVVATGGAQAIGANAQVGQMIGANATVGDATIQFGAETLSSEDHCFRDDPGYKNLVQDPKSIKVLPANQEDYDNHLYNRNCYRIQPRRCNQALLINIIDIPNYKKKGETEVRHGANLDSIRLKTLLDQLGFNVTPYENLTKEEIEQCVENFLSSKEVQTAPVVLLYIGSHGGRAYDRDYFVSADNKWVSIPDDIVKKFYKHRNALAGKPKIFWFQFCRKDIPFQDSIPDKPPDGEVTEMHETFKPRGLIEWFTQQQSISADGKETFGRILSDTFVGCATVPGSFAYRDTLIGSWFVYAIAHVFCQHARSDDLVELFSKVGKAVVKKAADNNLQQEVNVAGETFCTFPENVKLFFFP